LPVVIINPQLQLPNTDAYYTMVLLHNKTGKSILKKKFILFYTD